MQPTFRDLIAANKRNSVLLVVVFCLFVAVVALALGMAVSAYLDPDAAAQLDFTRGFIIGGAAGGIALLLSLLGYFAGQDFVLAVSGAHPITHDQDPELFNVVEEMALAAGVPMPRVYIIYDSALNAFATGRNPQHAAVAITSGLRSRLTRDELQGVIAHEMAHIRNYDIRLMLLLAVLVGTVVMLADLCWQVIRFAPSGRSNRDRQEKGGRGMVLAIVFVLAILLAILAPILAQLIQFAVSRQREYLADATAVQLTRYPQGLANALRKLHNDTQELRRANRGTAHLYIVNPIKKFRNWADTAFASHPPIEERIRRLESLTA